MYDVMDLIKRCINRSDNEEINGLLNLAYEKAEKIYFAKIAQVKVNMEQGKKVETIDKSLFPITAHSFLDLLMSDDWPEAAPSFLICDENEDDKKERAEGIIDFIEPNLEGKKILDFGCGEGHVAEYAAKASLKSIGYDLIHSGKLEWEIENSNFLLTTDWLKVLSNGPYDLIILYDVLDHCENPVEVLQRIKSVCKSDTKIFVRCHSFMSRHGGHLYRQLNKAWLHLFFSDEELEKIGVKMEFTKKTYFPIRDQKSWIQSSGLKIIAEDIIRTQVEDIFKGPLFVSRLPQEFKNHEYPEWQMSQVFNDYILGL